MTNCKKFIFYSLFIFLTLSSFCFVYAADPRTPREVLVGGLVEVIGGIQDAGKPLFSALLGDIDSGEVNVSFPKILVFLLVMLIVMAVLDAVASSIFSGEDKLWLRLSVGIIVSLLGVRFLPSDLIRQLALPSSALVASIAIILPFIIFGYFVYTTIKGSTFRRAAWVIYAMIFLVLWSQNYQSPWYWMYWGIILVCGVLFAFDGMIHKLWYRGKGARAYERLEGANRGRIIVRIDELQRELVNPATTVARKVEIRTEIKQLNKELKLR